MTATDTTLPPRSAGRRRFLGSALLCAFALPAVTVAARPRRRTLLREVPPAYRAAALAAHVPPRLLYGVALQESAMAFGAHILPWPWTLNIRGSAHRYAGYIDAVAALSHAVTVGRIRNVDCGPMQVNWGYHAQLLGSFARALEPHANLAAGARLLAGHYRDTGDWFAATGRYHNQADAERAHTYAASVFARVARLREAA
jgi:hypothetical protein